MSKKKRSEKQDTVVELLTDAHSKSICNKVVRIVGDDHQKFDELMNCFLGKDAELARRAAWPISYIVQNHPQLIAKWFPKIIQNLNRANQHPAIYRNIFRFLQVIDIPKKYSARILDQAYIYVLNPTHPPAVRAFALTTAWNVVADYPELASELRVVTRQVMTEDSKALKSRGKRTLRDLDRLLNSPAIR